MHLISLIVRLMSFNMSLFVVVLRLRAIRGAVMAGISNICTRAV